MVASLIGLIASLRNSNDDALFDTSIETEFAFKPRERGGR